MFFDFPNFDFEFNFKIKNTTETQHKIFFSKLYNSFCTIEYPLKINLIDIGTNRIKKSVSIDLNNGQHLTRKKATTFLKQMNFDFVMAFLELKELNMIILAISCQRLVFYNVKSDKKVIDKNLNMKQITDLIYVKKFKVLITVVYDTCIPVFEIELGEGKEEINFVGRLIGHLGFVISAVMIEDKDILVSIDEKSMIKFWNLRYFTCIKTVDLMGTKTIVKQIIYLKKKDLLSVISKKITTYKLEHNLADHDEKERNRVLLVYFNSLTNQFYIFTNLSLLIIEGAKPVIKKVIYYNKKNETHRDKIIASFVTVINDGRQFYLGDTRGNVFYYDIRFTLLSKLAKNKDGITNLRIFKEADTLLFSFSSNDIHIHCLSNNRTTTKPKLLRRLIDLEENGHKFVNTVASISMGILLLNCGNNEIYVVDQELNNVHSILVFPTEERILNIFCFDQLGLIVVYLSNHRIAVFDYFFDEQFIFLNYNLKMISLYQIKGKEGKELVCGNLNAREKDFDLILGYNDGEIIILRFNNEENIFKPKKNYTKKSSYNAQRNSKNRFFDFSTNFKKIFISLKENTHFCLRDQDENVGFVVYKEKNETNCLSYLNTLKLEDKRFHSISALQTDRNYITVLFGNRFKLFDYEGNCSIDFKIQDLKFNKWKFKYKDNQQRKSELEDVVKILKTINKRVEDNKSLLDNFIKIDLGRCYQSNLFLTQKNQKEKVVLPYLKRQEKEGYLIPRRSNLANNVELGNSWLKRSQPSQDIQPEQYD